MADPNRLYANDAKAMACARNLDETLRASQKLEDLLKMYYKEERFLHLEKAQLLFQTAETARKISDLTVKKKVFLENLALDFQRIRTSTAAGRFGGRDHERPVHCFRNRGVMPERTEHTASG